MTTGETFKTLEEHQPIAGAKTYVQVIKTPVYDAEGHAIGIQGAFWDVTDQVRVEETLREMNAALEQRVAERTHDLLEANVRLTELDQLKDEFIGRISHELRTPLTNIKLYLELLKRGKLEKHDQYMDTLHQQTDRLHRLIDDLLDISHLNLDTTDVRHELLDVNALMHDVMTEHAGVARERQLTLTLRPSSDLPRLTTDRALLRQVFAHLLSQCPKLHAARRRDHAARRARRRRSDLGDHRSARHRSGHFGERFASHLRTVLSRRSRRRLPDTGRRCRSGNCPTDHRATRWTHRRRFAAGPGCDVHGVAARLHASN